MLQKLCEKTINGFKLGMFPMLMSTSLTLRGLDIISIEHVINYDLPQSIDEYIHRIGRTGCRQY